MDKLNNRDFEGKTIYMSSTEAYLKLLFSKQCFTIKSVYPTINSILCHLEKGDHSFRFIADQILPIGPPVKYQHQGYGFDDRFELINKSFHLCIPKGVNSLRISFTDDLPVSGEITKMDSCKSLELSFWRAIIAPIKFYKKPFEYIESQAFKSERWFRGAGLIELLVNSCLINIYDIKINNNETLIIECKSEIGFSTFEEIVHSIIFSFGIISGSLIREELIYLQYNDDNLQEIFGFSYRNIEPSINGLGIIDPRIFAKATGSKNLRTSYLAPKIFQNIVENCIKDPRFLRALKMITESASFPLEIKASNYSVALETLKNIIIEENIIKINPFKDKRVAIKTINEIKSIVSQIDDKEFNNKQSVLNKIDQLNQVGNKEGILLSFKLLSIPLSEDDVKCLVERNNFLHGKIPFESETVTKDYRLQHIGHKLHMLLCALVLKYSGYHGYILNNLKLIDILHFKKNLNEPLLRNV
jgi:hypothetical protein